MPRTKVSENQTAAKEAPENWRKVSMVKSRLFRTATESVDKGQAYAYSGRESSGRDFRQLWIARISAATRMHGIAYGRFRMPWKKANIFWIGKCCPIWRSGIWRDLRNRHGLPSSNSPPQRANGRTPQSASVTWKILMERIFPSSLHPVADRFPTPARPP